MASPVLCGGQFLLFGSGGTIIAIDAKDGHELYEEDLDNGFYASPVAVGGKIVAVNLDGDLYAFAPGEDKIETVNGERVYIDTKRTAPEKTGTPAHYYANGKTSYGFDWDYSGGGNFLLRCDYNFDQHQYDFQFYGVTPGTATTTLYYFTDDNVKVPVTLTVNVDNDLNVSIG